LPAMPVRFLPKPAGVVAQVQSESDIVLNRQPLWSVLREK
jgi:hypothetical protein